MKSFEMWLSELINDDRWFELLRHYKNTTIEAAAKKVYAQLVADSTVDVRPMSENRKHVYNILCKNPGDKVNGKNWYETKLWKEAEKAEKEWVPVSEEERQRRLAEFKAIIDSAPILNNFPRLKPGEKEANGDWIASKGTPHPVTSPMERYVKERHLAYIEENFDPRTAMKLPGAIDEDLYNVLYDEKNYDAYVKVFKTI